MKDNISVGTGSTGSLSDSDNDSVTDMVDESGDKAAVASSAGLFKTKLTELRLQRRDAHEAQVITERLTAISKTKENKLGYIDTYQKNLSARQEKYEEQLKKIAQADELIKIKQNDLMVLKTKVKQQKTDIDLIDKQTEDVFFLTRVWRSFYTAIYHAFGWKTTHETLRERRDQLVLERHDNRSTITTKNNEIKTIESDQKKNEKVRFHQETLIMYLTNEIERDKKIIEDLKKEEADLIALLPEFKNTSESSNQAIDRMIRSCDKLAQPSMLSKIQRTKMPPSAQVIVAQALSEFLKKPTQTTQAALAASMQDNPTYTEEPKLQKLLEEAKNYYTEVDEILKPNAAGPTM
ncbi:MAG: hypothetical protein P1U39_07355 [Legionellaceae bacterium]|nr:hypothetical protein [Legionellaceae bacterium]